MTHPADRKAQQRTFSEMMSDEFSEACRQPHHAVVALLTGVVFDLPDGPSEEAVWKRRKRRRPNRTK